VTRWTRLVIWNRSKKAHRPADASEPAEPLPRGGDGILDDVAFTAAVSRALAHGADCGVVYIRVVEEEVSEGALLMAVEARIANAIRPSDTLGRLDDGALAVLTDGEGADGGASVASRILERLRAPFAVGGREIRAVTAVGTAGSVGTGDGAALIARARAAAARSAPPTSRA
jgi:hypothetical protein